MDSHRSVLSVLWAVLMAALSALAVFAILFTQCRRDHWNRPEISGVIRDSDSHTPIENARITVSGPGYSQFVTYTGSEGKFCIPPATFRRWQHRQVYATKLSIQKAGYHAEKAETWHKYGEGSTEQPAPKRYLELFLESAGNSRVVSDRPTHFFQ